MTEGRFLTLGDAVEDENFPEVDLILRRGRHIDRDDAALYAYLTDAADQLEPFYRRFGCELVHASEGYFYLLPTNDKLGRRHLGVPEMLVGQALALLYLDPATLQNGGVITKQDALSRLASVTGSDALTQAFNPKRKRVDERVAEETVRAKFGEALRRLATLGFVDLLENDGLKLRAALMRFAEPVKGEGSSLEALERLVARGELVMGTGDDEEESDALEPEPAEREPKAPKKRPEREATPLPPAVAEAMVDFEQFGAEFDTASAPADAASEGAAATESVGEGARRFAELFPDDEPDEELDEPEESEPANSEPVSSELAASEPADGEIDESEPDVPVPDGGPEPWDAAPEEPDGEPEEPDGEPEEPDGEPDSEREGEH